MGYAKSLTLLLAASAGLAYAQLPVHVGLKAGGVWNRQEISQLSTARIFPATIGAYAEVDLPFLPIVETGIFWKRYQLDSSENPRQGLAESRANILEIPILLKKRFKPLPIQPFISGGTTLRYIPSLSFNGASLNGSSDTGAGLTVAAGLSFPLLFFRLEPEFRATRWILGQYLPRKNQAEFLVGIRF